MKETASPKLIPPTLDGFTFATDEGNKAIYDKTKNKIKKVIEESSRRIIYRTGDTHGYYVGYDKLNDWVYYVVKYEEKKNKVAGKTLTQVLVWRDEGNINALGLTAKMFFDVLLKHTGAILSDREQTPNGKAFWSGVLARAHERGFPIGIVYMSTGKIVRPNFKEETIEKFIKTKVPVAYGPTAKHENILLLVGPVGD